MQSAFRKCHLKKLFASLSMGMVVAALAILPVQAQNTSPLAGVVDAKTLGVAISRYYEKPFDIPEFLAKWQQFGRPGMEGMVGFLAGIFVKHPAEIRRVTAVAFDGTTQGVIVTALRVARRNDEAKKAAWAWNWPVEKLPAWNTRPFTSLPVIAPGVLDAFWGASFATGDSAYVRPIYDYYLSVAGQSDVDVRDIVNLARTRRALNKEASAKYSRETLAKIIIASSALWSLESNARQHKFVAAALDQYARAQPRNPAVTALAEFRAARQP